MSELVEKDEKINEEVFEKIQRIRRVARGSTQAMRDIVWLTNPSSDNIKDLASKMNEVANNMLGTFNWQFDFPNNLSEINLPSAYERLLYDIMIGDSTLFLRNDEVETAWKFLEPVQNAWANNPEIKIYGYPACTWGPDVSNDLIEGCGLTWRYPCKNLTDDGEYCEL